METITEKETEVRIFTNILDEGIQFVSIWTLKYKLLQN